MKVLIKRLVISAEMLLYDRWQYDVQSLMMMIGWFGPVLRMSACAGNVNSVKTFPLLPLNKWRLQLMLTLSIIKYHTLMTIEIMMMRIWVNGF